MSSLAYLTFDLGTTALKTALFSQQGDLLAARTVEYTPQVPHTDWAEMPADTYWGAAAAGVRAALAQAQLAPQAITAIGFSSQGQTFVPIDRAGRALHNAIVWVDNRAQAIADEWEARWLSREEFRQSSGFPWIPAFLTIFKIGWLARHVPQAHRAWKFLCLPDYLIYRLTGELATDYVTARMGGLLDQRTGSWNETLLAAAGISAEQLPPVLAPGVVAGKLRNEAADVLGLRPGIPVCTGANDQLVGALGAGNVRPGIATETTGTALALVVTTPRLVDDDRVVVGKHAVPDLGFAMTFATTSAIVLKWFRDICSPTADYDQFLDGVASIPPGCEGLTVLPHFAGTSLPPFNPLVRGAFAGLSLGHTRAHLARAIMESCACLLEECLAPIRKHAAVNVVRSLGGAARSNLWLQIKADLLGLPVERPACTDAASLGAAMLAAMGTGQFVDLIEAGDAWYRRERFFDPDAFRHAIYREVYARYRELLAKLYPPQASTTDGVEDRDA